MLLPLSQLYIATRSSWAVVVRSAELTAFSFFHFFRLTDRSLIIFFFLLSYFISWFRAERICNGSEHKPKKLFHSFMLLISLALVASIKAIASYYFLYQSIDVACVDVRNAARRLAMLHFEALGMLQVWSQVTDSARRCWTKRLFRRAIYFKLCKKHFYADNSCHLCPNNAKYWLLTNINIRVALTKTRRRLIFSSSWHVHGFIILRPVQTRRRLHEHRIDWRL